MTYLVIGKTKGFTDNPIVHFGTTEPLFATIELQSVTSGLHGWRLHPNQWHHIDCLSKRTRLPSFLERDQFYGECRPASRHQFNSLQWLAAYQSNGIYLQRVVPNHYLSSKVLDFEERAQLRQAHTGLIVHDKPDAVYFRKEDLLIYRNRRALLPILESFEPSLFQKNEDAVEVFMMSHLFEFNADLYVRQISNLNLIRMSYVSDFLSGIKYTQRKPIVEYLLNKNPRLKSNRSGARIVINSGDDIRDVIQTLEEELYRADDDPWSVFHDEFDLPVIAATPLQSLLSLPKQ